MHWFCVVVVCVVWWHLVSFFVVCMCFILFLSLEELPHEIVLIAEVSGSLIAELLTFSNRLWRPDDLQSAIIVTAAAN